MPIQLAQPKDMAMRDPRQGPLYKPQQQPIASEETSTTDMIKQKAMSEGMKKGEGFFKENIFDPLKTKAKEIWKGFSTPAPATAPASSFTSAPFASANIGPGGGMSGAFSPTVLPAELTGTMMSGTVPAVTEATIGSTGLGAATVLPELTAASTVAPTVASTVAPAVAPAVAAGPLAGMMASPLAPLVIGALAGKAFGLFDKGGKVEKNNIPVYANIGGLLKMASPAAMLMDKNKKPEDLLKNITDIAHDHQKYYK